MDENVSCRDYNVHKSPSYIFASMELWLPIERKLFNKPLVLGQLCQSQLHKLNIAHDSSIQYQTKNFPSKPESYSV